jgi:hypothetical protein
MQSSGWLQCAISVQLDNYMFALYDRSFTSKLYRKYRWMSFQLNVYFLNTKHIGQVVECIWNVMASAQKPDLVFHRNRQVHLNWQERQFSQVLAAKVCASVVVMLDTPCSELVWRVLVTHSTSFPFNSSCVCHRVPSHCNWTLDRLLWNTSTSTVLHVITSHNTVIIITAMRT